MAINIAEFDGGRIKLEISNVDEFVRAVKRAMREQKRDDLWKIRVVGSTRIPAPVQQLIDRTQGKPEESAAPPPPEPSPEETAAPDGQLTHKGDDDHNPISGKILDPGPGPQTTFHDFLRQQGKIS